MRYLFTVTYRGAYYREFCNHANGPEGVVLGPPLPEGHSVRVGDRLELRRPDGTLVKTTVYAFFQTLLRQEHIRLSGLLFLNDVPRDTEVWAVEDGDVW
jgi:hypothetical protein